MKRNVRPGDAYGLIGAYAVDAVTPEERGAVEAYLRDHPEALDEVLSLQEAAATLPAPEMTPPAHVRSELLAQVARTRPLPPVVPVAAERAKTPHAARRAILWLGAAAAAIVIAVAGVRIASDDAGSMPAPVAEVMHADDARESVIDMGEHKITVTRSMGMDKAVVTSTTMGRAPDGMAYQMWVKDSSGKMVSGGLLPEPEKDGLIAMPLHGDAGTAREVAVSMEPAGGSAQPTSKVLGSVQL